MEVVWLDPRKKTDGEWWASRTSASRTDLHLVVWRDSRRRVHYKIVTESELPSILEYVRRMGHAHNVFRLQHVFGAFLTPHRKYKITVTDAEGLCTSQLVAPETSQ